MYNKVEICGINTSTLVVLNERQKRDLLLKSSVGDKNAREQLINGNLRLVLSVLQSFGCRNEPADDLFQVGCIGLIKAIDHFDVNMDVKFSTYAVPMILGEMRRYVRDNNAIRVSRSLRDLAYKALQSKERLATKLKREPTVEEIASELNVNKSEIINALDAITEPISLYEPVYTDSSDSVYVLDQIKDSVNTDEAWITTLALNEAIEKLEAREKRILSLRFFSGRTQTEVASEIGISQAQVSRIEKSAVEKIKNKFGS